MSCASHTYVEHGGAPVYMASSAAVAQIRRPNSRARGLLRNTARRRRLRPVALPTNSRVKGAKLRADAPAQRDWSCNSTTRSDAPPKRGMTTLN